MAAQDCPGGKSILPVSFFKIILETNLERIKIPNKFTHSYESHLSNPVFLKPPDGTQWKVHWAKQDGEVWFEKGWKEFAENYSLDHGSLVVFEYKGISQFDVVILDKSALEIDYPLGETCENTDQNNDDESVAVSGESPDRKHKQKSPLFSPPPHKKMRGENCAAQRPSLSLNWPRGARAKEVAQAFVSNNPFFTATVPINLAENRLYVSGLESYVENIEKYVKLQIGKRSWDVKLLPRRPTTGRRFSAGWSLFVKENELLPGDVCVFELISREDIVFEVHVYKSHN